MASADFRYRNGIVSFACPKCGKWIDVRRAPEIVGEKEPILVPCRCRFRFDLRQFGFGSFEENIQLADNLMDRVSIFVQGGTPAASLPEPIKQLLSPVEREVLENPANFFRACAGRVQLDSFRQWLLMLASPADWHVEIHESECVPLTVLLRVYPSCWWGEGVEPPSEEIQHNRCRAPALELPRQAPPEDLHDVLKEVYSVLKGTVHGCWMESGGLVWPVDSLEGLPIDPEDELEIPPAQCRVFYCTSTGDELCWTGDELAVWYYHETQAIAEAGYLEHAIDQYFQHLVDGRELTYDSYSL